MDKERRLLFKEVLGQVRVSCDIDGVILISAAAVVKKFNSDFLTNYSLQDITHWEVVRDLAYKEFRLHGLANEEADKKAKEYDNWVWTDEEVLAYSPAACGAQAFLKGLYLAGVDYCFITSRIPALTATTISSFRKYFPWEDPSKIIINNDTSLRGKEFKWRTIAEKGIGIHIDDSQEHAQLIVENTPAKVILLSYPGIQEQGFCHPRLIRFNCNGRQANLRDLHKAILFQGLSL